MSELESNSDSILAAEYVLGLMTPQEKMEFEARLDQEQSIRDEHNYWAERLVDLTDSLAPLVPSEQVKLGLEARLFSQIEQDQKYSWFNNIFSGRLFGGVAASCIIALGIWLVVPPSFSPNYRAELVAQDQNLVVSALYDAKNRQLQIKSSVGRAKPGHDYELWAIVGDDAPVSLGVLVTDGTQMLQIPEHLASVLSGAVLAISDEPVGGSKTGAPTGPVVAISSIAVI